MIISIHQQGGFFGIDRSIKIDDGLVSVVEDGVEQQVQRLDSDQKNQINSLAQHVAEVSDSVTSYSGETISDGLTCHIAIESEAGRKNLTVSSGDQAPDVVWELIGVVDGAASAGG